MEDRPAAPDVDRPTTKPRQMANASVIVMVLAGVVFSFVVVAALGHNRTPIDLIIVLLGGWTSFLARTIPKIGGNLSIAAMTITCSAIALWLGHQFLRWLASAIQQRRAPSENARPWRIQWTLCGYASIWMVFLVGMAAGGILHQLGWIASSPEPMVESKGNEFRSYIQQRHLMRQFKNSLTLTDSNLEVAIADFRDALASRDLSASGHSQLERYQLFLITAAEDPNEVVGSLIFPRERPSYRSWVGAIEIEGKTDKVKTEEELRQHLETFRDRLIAL
ncbi:MAG: hypothetical protein ACI9UA_000265 [Pseudoalteromonas tetraodonis]|jgi:hypothetical protein